MIDKYNTKNLSNQNEAETAIMAYDDAEIPLPPHNKQYLGLAGVFSGSIGYPLQSEYYISLTTPQGQTLDFKVCYQTFQTLMQHQARLNLDPTENLWLWVSVDAFHEIEDWRLFKSDLPDGIIQNLYEKSQHFESLLNLLELVQSFKMPLIRNFAQSLMYRDTLMKNWLSLPASKQHHHSFPGGLIVHSLEVAQMVKNHLAMFSLEVSLLETEITILAALLHDIGKTQTLTQQLTQNSHTGLGRLMDHEKLTLSTLAEHIEQLKQKSSKTAETLQYLLTWKSNEGFCKFIGGEIIKNADQISTKLSLRRMGFADKPDYFTYTKVVTGGSCFYLNRL